MISGAVVTKLQYMGYAIALCGVWGYSSYKRAQGAGKTPAANLPRLVRATKEEEAMPLANADEGVRADDASDKLSHPASPKR